MNKLFTIFFACILSLLPALSSGQGFQINLDLQNSLDTIAYLGHHFGTQRYVDDTANVVNGPVEFSGSTPLPEGIYFYYTPSTYFEFLIGQQSFSIKADARDVVNTIDFTNSPVNVGFYYMQRYTAQKRQESNELKKQMELTQDAAAKAKYEQELLAINDAVLTYQKSLQQEYPGSMLDRLIQVMQKPTIPDAPDNADQLLFDYLYYKNHYWANIDIADPG